MPRDAGETRSQLILAGQREFARLGVHTASLKLIVKSAGQRNSSALHYHFGGRSGLLAAIIDLHNDDIEDERRKMLDAAGDDASIEDLVSAVVIPLARKLHTRGGRDFLAILSQLVDLFSSWNVESSRTPPEAMRAFQAIRLRTPSSLPDHVRIERVTLFLETVVAALGARARLVEKRVALPLDDEEFLENLVSMSVGALSAPTTRVRAQRSR